jgi:hypothetical protein
VIKILSELLHVNLSYSTVSKYSCVRAPRFEESPVDHISTV